MLCDIATRGRSVIHKVETRQLAVLCGLGLTLIVPGLLLAATLEPVSLERLIHRAGFIVRGRIQAITPGPIRTGAPSTIIAVSVQDQWKGRRLSAISLLQPRGTEKGITQDVPGLPTFHVGEEVILFLVRAALGEYQVVGGRQGKFVVKTVAGSGRRIVEGPDGTQFDLAQFLGRLGRARKSAP